MIDERKEELAALYALDLLQGAERSSFEAELSRDPELQMLVDQLRAASAEFALVSPTVTRPPALRQRILDSIATIPQVAPKNASSSKAPDSNVIRFPALAWLGWAVAACFALSSAYLGMRIVTTRAELGAEKERAELASIELRSTQQKSEAERILATRQLADLQQASDLAQLKIAKLASLNGNSPEAVAIAVWNPLQQQGVLTVESLPRIQKDQDYQLWVIDPQYQSPVSGGVFNVDAKGTARINFRPDQPVTAATQFAISRERKGGSKKPEGQIVAAGAL